ncbi:hypothetical protein MTO96_041004, partial [Rhipicephalus appendiculatus]
YGVVPSRASTHTWSPHQQRVVPFRPSALVPSHRRATNMGLAVLPHSLNTAAFDVTYAKVKLGRKDVQTQCTVYLSVKTTQANIGSLRRCTRVRTKRPVKDSECQTDLELPDISLVEEMQQPSSVRLQSAFSDIQR